MSPNYSRTSRHSFQLPPHSPSFRLPPHGTGQCIGLLGGSFNPAHAGHRMMSLIAMKRLKLDAVWWLVTPANPLKNPHILAPLHERMRDANHIKQHPRIIVSDIEHQIGTQYTIDLLKTLRARAPATRFIWLMGADNLMTFHKWNQWRDIARLMPIAVIDRPQATLKSTHSVAAIALMRFRKSEVLPLKKDAPPPLPCWYFIHGKRSDVSSTRIRAAREN